MAEESIIARDVLLAEHVGSRVHICHLSTAGSVEIVRWAKSRGIDVTAEVTPHHLLLTDELVRSYNPVFKVNPPLRTERDVLALREALADGTIDIVATDHAPHPHEDKDCEWAAAAMGMVGLRPRCQWYRRPWWTPGSSPGPGSPSACPPSPQRSGGHTGTAVPSRLVSPPTSRSSTRNTVGRWTPRASRRAAATPRTRGVSCRAV